MLPHLLIQRTEKENLSLKIHKPTNVSVFFLLKQEEQELQIQASSSEGTAHL